MRLDKLEKLLYSSSLAEDFYTSFLEKGNSENEYLQKIFDLGIKSNKTLSENFVETVNSLHQNNYDAPQLRILVEDLRSNGYDLRSRRGSEFNDLNTINNPYQYNDDQTEQMEDPYNYNNNDNTFKDEYGDYNDGEESRVRPNEEDEEDFIDFEKDRDGDKEDSNGDEESNETL